MGAEGIASNGAMENVVRLADYLKRRKSARRHVPVPDGGPQYYCLRCDGEDFKLYASGAVHCTHCGSLMRNLLIESIQGEESSR